MASSLFPIRGRRTIRMQVLKDLLLNLLATVVGIFVVYALFRPHIRLGYCVRARRTADDRLVYNCSYRNAGLLKVYDVRIRVNLRYLDGPPGGRTWQLLSVPVDDAEGPVLGRRKGRKFQLPNLLLEDVDRGKLPVSKRPTAPIDLRALLASLDATPYLHVAALRPSVRSVRSTERNWAERRPGGASTTTVSHYRTRTCPPGLL